MKIIIKIPGPKGLLRISRKPSFMARFGGIACPRVLFEDGNPPGGVRPDPTPRGLKKQPARGHLAFHHFFRPDQAIFGPGPLSRGGGATLPMFCFLKEKSKGERDFLFGEGYIFFPVPARTCSHTLPHQAPSPRLHPLSP